MAEVEDEEELMAEVEDEGMVVVTIKMATTTMMEGAGQSIYQRTFLRICLLSIGL